MASGAGEMVAGTRAFQLEANAWNGRGYVVTERRMHNWCISACKAPHNRRTTINALLPIQRASSLLSQ